MGGGLLLERGRIRSCSAGRRGVEDDVAVGGKTG